MTSNNTLLHKNSLAWGAICLFIANLFSRVLGFLYRIMLVRLVGSEGIGLSEMVSPIYSFCLVAASCGLPLAMSRLVAAQIGNRKYENIERIWRLTLRTVCVWSAAISLAAFFMAPILVENFAADQRILMSFRVVTPAIFVVSVCSCFRGYFQATRQIAAIGFSQNIEQLVRVCLGLGLSYWLLPYGPDIVIIGISLSTVIGELCGLGTIIMRYKRHKPIYHSNPTLARRTIANNLLIVGIPLTGHRLLMSLLMMVQAFIIPKLLINTGLSISQATAEYGSFTGVAMTLLNLPGIFTTTLSTAILPAIAEVNTKPALLEDRINQSLQLNTVIGLPVASFLYIYAKELCILLFNAPDAALCLKALSVGAWFVYTQALLNSVQQGLGTIRELLFNLLISGLVYISAMFILIPHLKIVGAAAAYVMFSCTNCLLSFIQLKSKRIKLSPSKFLIMPLFALSTGLLISKTATKLLAAVFITHYISYIQLPILAFTYFFVLKKTNSLPTLIVRYLRR